MVLKSFKSAILNERLDISYYQTNFMWSRQWFLDVITCTERMKFKHLYNWFGQMLHIN